MDDTAILYRTIKQLLLHWRHPELLRILRRIERKRMRPAQAKRWLKKIKPWEEEQEKCFNPFGPAPQSQEEMGRIDLEVGCLLENPSVRAGIKILERPTHTLATGSTGSGKSNLIRNLIYGIDKLNRAYDRAHHDPGA